MSDDRLRPRKTSVQYAVRRPLLNWLRTQDVAGLRVLDVGCGDRPYETLLAGAAEIVGFDVPGNLHADLHGSIEALPVEDASFDVVLCLQVLEHVPHPAAAVRELRRVVRQGGRLVLGVPVRNVATNSFFRLVGYDPEEIHPSSHRDVEAAIERSALTREERLHFPRALPLDLAGYVSFRCRAA